MKEEAKRQCGGQAHLLGWWRSMKPTLCLVPAYFSPGLPIPISRSGGSLSLCLLRLDSQSKTLATLILRSVDEFGDELDYYII